ncbi:selenide, water dikinase SelD [Marivita sp. XM-24bin2]|uniref:selenide, water dikinase SelD n=1 Tax=unclassified Marivita TaxID=2632480 RepID=UPI000D7916EC|nr:selenide, water dikinase SelD [Marivita sp. XM-24bin2]MCR9108807.1 selenide, water dikinase SelD [Paracoccaceae bacterium]PWL34197.1 MAG: selenide, water dikinase SelD [Marivita sp. XM-24bin2]
MHQPPLPLTQDLVLIGGGHTHALVLRKWAMKPLPGARLTLINPGPTAPYSGMLPGFVAGHYSREQLDIDLVRLAQAANARLIIGSVIGIDPNSSAIEIDTHPAIGFDTASVDVGITSDMPSLPGFAEHAIPAKPLGPFAAKWDAYRTGEGPTSVAIIGGGVAGVELAMAMSHALSKRNRASEIHLIDNSTALSALPSKSADRLRAALRDQNVTLHENAEITHLTANAIHLKHGSTIEADFITGAAGARPYPWLAETGLTTHDGFLTVNDRLQTSDARIFAVGDCAHMSHAPRPKAGVYAVRQAPVLFHNLASSLSGGPLKSYVPQKDYLKLISLGKKSALGDRFGLAFSGSWVWDWKDRIDRKFMNQFDDLPRMPKPPLPYPRAKGVQKAMGPKPLCGGCGAKLGRDALSHSLATLKPAQRDDITPLPGDDAALLNTGGARQVLTTDHLRSFWSDPAVMARIATHHALGDIWAMGADPQAATLSITLPRLSETLAERTLTEILTSAQSILQDAGADIVGGHSTLGDEFTIGLSVTGLLDRDPVTLGGAQDGSALILTKPIGTGVIMAALMSGKARGEHVADALQAMQQGQKTAAHLLRDAAQAMTDLTGFGLAGHTQNICLASGLSATLTLDAIPLLPGALALTERGEHSSLYANNRAGFSNIEDSPHSRLLFDPQTGGGLLAAVPADQAGILIETLHQNGHPDSAIIGHLQVGPIGQISIV